MKPNDRTWSLDQLGQLCGASVAGDGGRRICGVRALDRAGEDELSFLTSGAYLQAARDSGAGALLVAPSAVEELPGRDLLVVEDPYRALAVLLGALYPAVGVGAGVHATAIVDETATVAATANIGPYCVVGPEVVLEEGAVLEAFVYVAQGCVVGRGSVLHAHTTLYPRTVLGESVEVHSGTVLGADGFGFAEAAGRPIKLPQVGSVVIGDRVEIGANSAIDRATLEETRIGSDTKIDNLVQIGHNVEVGAGSILCGQAGIAGSAKLGRGVVMAGQAGSAGHLRIGDGARVAAQGAVLSDVADGETVGGSPAIPFRRWRRAVAVFARLDELKKRVRQLEKALEERGP